MRLVFFGTPAFAVPSLRRLLDSTHEIAAVVTQPDRPSGRGRRIAPGPVKRVALDHGVAVWQPPSLRDARFAGDLAGLGADLGVVVAYGKLLPPLVLSTPRDGLINVHASLLPAYRGAAPVRRAIMDGATETGVTIMRVVEALDAGPVLAARGRPIGLEETGEQVEADLARLGADLLIETLEAIRAGTAVEVPQDDDRATYAPRLQKAEGRIDWERPARAIHDQVRALHPWPLAFTFLETTRYVIRRTAIEPGTARAQPGTIVAASGDTLAVATGDGGVRILELQPEGRRPMPPREFLAGRRLERGMRFVASPPS